MSSANSILIVEDELLIAMDIEATLKNYGWQVAGVVGSCDDAIAFLRDHSIDAAVMDYNLSEGTTIPIADVLTEKNVPFIFVSGDSQNNLPEAHSDVEIIGKPIDFKILHEKLTALTSTQKD